MTATIIDELPALGDAAPPRDAGDAVRQVRDRTRGPRSRAGNRGGRKGGHKPTKAELEREVKQLRAERADDADAAAPDAGQDAALLAAALTGPLAASILTASKMLARVTHGAHWELAPEEAGRLAEVWAPVTAPQLARHADKLPVLMACGVTLEVLMPRVEQQLAMQRAASHGAERAALRPEDEIALDVPPAGGWQPDGAP